MQAVGDAPTAGMHASENSMYRESRLLAFVIMPAKKVHRCHALILLAQLAHDHRVAHTCTGAQNLHSARSVLRLALCHTSNSSNAHSRVPSKKKLALFHECPPKSRSTGEAPSTWSGNSSGLGCKHLLLVRKMPATSPRLMVRSKTF